LPLLIRYRLSLSVFILGLVLAGVTAFPLLHELSLLAAWLGISDPAGYQSLSGLQRWIAFVYFGLQQTHAHFPFLAYGTDWLAFGHLVIAMFFIGPFLAPLRNEWVLYIGLVACVAVFPLALICGPIRQIPFYWTLIDCSFGFFGLIPLLYCLHLTRRMREHQGLR
jgi:hypothetical protein